MNPIAMQPYIAPQSIAKSPSKTGILVMGISLLTIGASIVVLYLVKKSREADAQEMKSTREEAKRQKEANDNKVVETFGSGTVVNASDDVGCNKYYNKNQEVLEIPDTLAEFNSNTNKCGIGVITFQTYLNEQGINIPVDGQYGSKTKKAHKQWLKDNKLVDFF